jgi:SH3-like domain-containing protein
MKKWLLAVVGLAAVGAGAVAQDDVKAGEAKVAFEKKSYPYEGEVTVERLNVRMFPKNDATSIITSVLGLGEKVTVVAEKDEYFQILPPRGSIVWVASKNIKREGDKGVAAANEIPVRLDSRINADVLCTLKEGESVKVAGEHMGWLKIEAPAAVKYFVGKKYVHTARAAEATPVAAPAADEKKTAKAAPLTGSDAEARVLMDNAYAELKKQDALLAAKNFDQMDYGTVIADFKAAVEKAKSDDVRKEAERGLERVLAVNRALETAKVAVDAQKKAEAATLAEKLKAKAAEPKTQFQGYLDTTGILFKRPGTHKLVMDGRIIAFLRVKDGDEKMLSKFNNQFQKLVGINGTVINNPEGWDGYKVIVVDELFALEKNKDD